MTAKQEAVERASRVAAEIEQEMSSLEQVAWRSREILRRFAKRRPGWLELHGVAATVHDFYSVVENVAYRIAAEINGGLPRGADWHTQLLSDMALTIPGVRPAVLAKKTVLLLQEYLRFRHLFRHRYGMELDWSRLKPLVGKVPIVARAFRNDIKKFVRALRKR